MKKYNLLLALLLPFTMMAQISSFPYTEDFEGTMNGATDLPTNWDESGLSTDGIWSTGDATAASSGFFNFPANTIFAYTNDDACNCDKSEDRLITPVFDFSALTQSEFTFDFYTGTAGSDLISIEVSTDSGATFTPIDTLQQVGSWTNLTINLDAYTGAGFDKVAIAVKYDDGGAWGYGVGIDNIYIGPPPACPIPTALAEISTTSTDATVGWTENGTATQWQIEYGTTGFTQGTGSLMIANSQTPTITGLTPQTTYDFYVRAICGPADTSVWSGLGSFTTQCAALTAPYSESFSTSIPSCWAQGSSNSENWVFATSGGHVGNAGTISGSTNSGGAFAYVDDSSPHNVGTELYTPMVDVSALTTPELVFFHISDNEGDSNVDFHVDVWDGANWNDSLFFSDTNTTNGAWELISIDLSTLTITGPIQVRFVVDENNGTDFDDDRAIDDVEIRETPSCSAPLSATVDSINTTSAFLSWTEIGTATQWEIQYGAPGFTPGTGTFVSVSSNPYTLTGLSAFTNYDWYLRSICGPGDTSAWNGPNTISINYCTPAPTTVDGNGITNVSFDTVNNTTGAEAGNYADYTSFIGDAAQGATVPLDITYSTGFTYVTLVYIDWNNDLDFDDPNETVYSGTSTATNPTTLNASFTVPASQPLGQYRMRIGGADTGPPTPCYTGSWASFEDYTVNVVAPPPCQAPNSLTASNVTATAADLAWTELGTATNWEVEYGTSGFTQGTGTSVITTSNPYTVTALSSNTSYDFYVRSICGPADTSVWSTSGSFTTPCNIYPAPFLESFDVNSLPICWAQGGNTAWEFGPGFNAYGASGVTDHTGTSGFFIGMDGSDNSGSDSSWLISPFVDVSSLTSPQLSFYMFSNNVDDAALNRTRVDVWDGSAWVQVDSIQTNLGPNWDHRTYDLSALSITTTTAVRLTITPTTTGGSAFYNDILFDDISIRETPTCPTPTALVTDSTQANQAFLSWTENGTATQWQIEYGVSGFTPGTGTIATLNSNPGSISGLNGSTAYDWYVRSICGPGDTSAWSFAGSFVTACGPITAPWFDDVEAHTPTTSLSTSLCWTATANQTTNDWNIDGSGSTPSSGTGPSGANSGTNYFYFEASGGGSGNEAYLETPEVDINSLTTPLLSFYYHMFGDGRNIMADLYIDVYDGTSYTLVDSIIGEQQSAQSDPFLEKLVDLSAFSDTIKIRFTAVWNGAQWGDISLDDFSIDEAPSCPKPVALNAVNVNATDALVSWDEFGSATQWEVEWDTAGYTLGNATNSAIVNTDTFYLITGLNPEASYDWSVRAICGPADTSLWGGIESFTTPPTCPMPTAQASIPSNTSANLSWTENGSATTWEIEYGAPGFTQGTGTSVIVTSNPYNLTGLTAQTSYDWYVRSICGPADSSVWTMSNSFTTLCNPFVAPFSESFDATTQPSCWSQSAIQGGPWNFGGPGFTWNTTQCSTVPSDHTGNSGSFAALDFSVPDAGVVLELPIIDVSALTAPYLEFYYTQCNNFSPNNVLYIETSDGNSWSLLDSITRGTNGWEDFGFNLSSAVYNTNFVRVRFRAEDGGGTQFYGDMGIDDVSVDEAPACPDPTNPSVSGVSTTSADLSWTENGTATNWEIELGAPGFTPGTGAGTTTIVSSNPYTAVGLSVATSYDFYVRSICGPADTSGYSSVASFTTQCNSFSAPYSENFDGATTPGLPSCWSAINSLGVNIQTVTSTDHAVALPSAPNCIEYDVASGTGAYLISPAFNDLSSGLNQIRVQLAFEGGSSTFPGQIIVGTLADASDSTTFTPYDTIDGLTDVGLGFTEITVQFDQTSVFGSDSIIAFKNINGGGGFEFFLDDFIYEPIPLPYYPIGVINTVDANGVADSLGVELRTSGTVVGIDFDGNNGLSFTIVDMSTNQQEGINIFNFNDVSNYTVTEGDSIMVWGDIDQFNGLQEVFVDSIAVLATNRPLPAPNAVNNLDESTESRWLSLSDDFVLLDPSQSGSYNMDATNGVDTITIRVDADTDVNDSINALPNGLLPGDTICGMFGIGGQFDNSNPFTSGYQIFPVRYSDLTVCTLSIGLDESAQRDAALNIYPNPTNGEVTIQANSLKTNDARMMIRDISGKILFEERLNSSTGFIKTIDLSDRAKGIYFITIIDGDNTINEKLIKN